MQLSNISRRQAVKLLAASTLAAGLEVPALAVEKQVVDSIHFLIPGGAGG